MPNHMQLGHCTFWGLFLDQCVTQSFRGHCSRCCRCDQCLLLQTSWHEWQEQSNALGHPLCCNGCWMCDWASGRRQVHTRMNTPASLQKACIAAIAFKAVSFWGMWLFELFSSICLFTLIRQAGSLTNWIFSSIILQARHMPSVMF